MTSPVEKEYVAGNKAAAGKKEEALAKLLDAADPFEEFSESQIGRAHV